MFRYDIINRFILQRFGRNCNYLEIGLSGSACYNKILSNNKMSIDPNPECSATYTLPSDIFFNKLRLGELNIEKDSMWDIIFIDGLHTADQVYRDIVNATRHTKENGVIILHDCSPPAWQYAHSDEETCSGDWNGSVWKSFYFIRTVSEYLTYTIDTDWGVGIIDKKYMGSKIEHTNVFFDFGVLKKNRQQHLGLISVDEFNRNSLM